MKNLCTRWNIIKNKNTDQPSPKDDESILA